MGNVYINFVDLMETVGLKDSNTKGGLGHNIEDYMDNKENVEELKKFFKRIKSMKTSERVTGILFEEGRGRAFPSDYGLIAKWLRSYFPVPQYIILLHARGGTGTENAASLDAVVGFIPQAAQSGHNSYFLFLDNLITNKNQNVWSKFDLHTGIETAKMLYALNFNSVSFPHDCPVWGGRTHGRVHTAFDITTPDEWRSRTGGIYHSWSDGEKVDFDERRKSLAAIEKEINAKREYNNYGGFRIAPLVTNASNIGDRLGELWLIQREDYRPVGDVKHETADKARLIMLGTMNAGLRINYNNPVILEQVVKWIKKEP